MIQFFRTASVAPGRMTDAIAHAKAIAEHLETNHGYKVQVYVPCAGRVGQIQWRTEHRDMGELEARLTKMNADPKMAEFGKRGPELYLPGTIEDSIWRTA
jgi:hypothetical protein